MENDQETPEHNIGKNIFWVPIHIHQKMDLLIRDTIAEVNVLSIFEQWCEGLAWKLNALHIDQLQTDIALQI